MLFSWVAEEDHEAYGILIVALFCALNASGFHPTALTGRLQLAGGLEIIRILIQDRPDVQMFKMLLLFSVDAPSPGKEECQDTTNR